MRIDWRRQALARRSAPLRRGLLVSGLLGVLLALSIPLAAQPATRPSRGAVLPIRGVIDDIMRDSLERRIADARADGADTVVHVLLARDDVACLASLPSILGPVTRPSPTTLKVNLARTQDDPTGGPAWRLGVCGRDGELHSLQPARPGENTIDLGEFLKAHSNRPPVCVKLVDPSGQLIDAAAVE